MACSPDANASLIPSMSLTMKGGSHFPVYDPIIVISTQVVSCSWTFFFLFFTLKIALKILISNDLQSKLVYCLAVVKSTELNIIGRKSCILHVIN